MLLFSPDPYSRCWDDIKVQITPKRYTRNKKAERGRWSAGWEVGVGMPFKAV